MKRVLWLWFMFFALVANAQEPRLLWPKHQVVTADKTINFSWNTSEAPYRLYISTSPDFAGLVTDTIISSSSLQITLPPGTFFWRVVSIPKSTSSQIREVTVFNPSELPGLSLWLNAGAVSTVNTKVTELTDLSGNSLSATQSDTAASPDLIPGSLNGNPVLRFDGTDDFMAISQPLVVGQMFIVANYSKAVSTFPDFDALISGSAVADVLIGDQGATGFFGSGVFGNNIKINSFPSSTFAPFADVKIISAKTSTRTLPDVQISKYSNFSTRKWKGDIAEIIAFDRQLTEEEEKLVTSYLRYKYAPQVNLGADINFSYSLCDSAKIDGGMLLENHLWSSGESSQEIYVKPSAKVQYRSVTASDTFGFSSLDTITITTLSNKLDFDTAYICDGDSLTFDPAISGYDYSWSNSTTDSILLLTTPGTYWLTITDSLGCTLMSDTLTGVTDYFSSDASLGEDTSFCKGNFITLNQPAISYLWSTGSSGNTLIIDSTGAYSVTAINQNGCTVLDTVNVIITGTAPTVDFINSTGCINNAVTFTDLSSPAAGSSLISWQWNISNGFSSPDKNPSATFPDTGTYSVTLLVTADNNCSNWIQKSFSVYPVPNADFTFSGNCGNTNFSFLDKSTTPGSTATGWEWNFSDTASGTANVSTLKNSVHVFSKPGPYVVRLVTTNAFGCPDTAYKTVTPSDYVKADFTTSTACEKNPVAFQNLSAPAVSTSPVQYSWNFGTTTGAASDYLNPSYTYASSGDYLVTLSVRSATGCWDTIKKMISVNPLPVSGFSASGLQCAGNQIIFADTSKANPGIIASRIWSVQDLPGMTGTDSTFAFSSIKEGNYGIKLLTMTSAGCRDSVIKLISIDPVPVVAINATPQTGSVPHAVEFSSIGSGVIYYNWNFGDGTTSTDAAPVHTFNSDGQYNVTLTGVSGNGCSAQSSIKIIAFPPNEDIALTTVIPVVKDGFLSASVYIANQGTNVGRELDVTMHLNNESQVKEQWKGILEPGKGTWFTFSSRISISSLDENYLCAEVSNALRSDDADPQNNRLCTSLSEEAFKVFAPYPNPVGTTFTVPVIMPYEGEIRVQVFMPDGKTVGDFTQAGLPKGLNLLGLSPSLSEGIYIVRVSLDQQSQTFKIIKK